VHVTAAAIAPSGDYAYFATNPQSFRYTMPSIAGHLIRVRLRDFVLAGNFPLRSGENSVSAIAIDPQGRHAYLGTSGDPNTDLPASLLRIRLSSLSRDRIMHFESGTYGLQSGIVSPKGQAVYWGTLFGEITGVSLPDMNILGSVMLQRDTHEIRAGVVDPSASFAYYGTGHGSLLKIDLNRWFPTASLTLHRDGTGLAAAAIDRAGRYTYWVTDGSPARISRVDLEKFSPEGELLLAAGENMAVGIFLDEPHSLGYIITRGPGARVIRVNLKTLQRLDVHPLPEAFGEVSCVAYDRIRRKLYLGMGTSPARLIQVDMTIPSTFR